MSATVTSENIASGFSEAALLGQQNLVRFSRGYECLMKGLINVAIQQIELSRGLLENGVEDFNLLTQARTPDAFVQAELEVFRRRSERALGAAQKISAELNKTFAEMSEAAQTTQAAN